MTANKPVALMPEEWTARLAPSESGTVDYVYREWIRFPLGAPQSACESVLRRTIAAAEASKTIRKAQWGRDADGRYWAEIRMHGSRVNAIGAHLGEIVGQQVHLAGAKDVQGFLVYLMAALGHTWDFASGEEIEKKLRSRANAMSQIVFRRFPAPLRAILMAVGLPLFAIYRLRGGRVFRHLQEFLEQQMGDAV